MKTSTLFFSACGMVATILLQTTVASAQASDEAQIRALEDSFAAGIRAKDLDAIMNVYVPDQTLFVFDVVPPRQYVGAEACRKDCRARRHEVIGDRSAHYVEIKATNDTESRNEEAYYEQAQGFEDHVSQAVPTLRSPRRNSIRSLVGGVGDLTALRILRR